MPEFRAKMDMILVHADADHPAEPAASAAASLRS